MLFAVWGMDGGTVAAVRGERLEEVGGFETTRDRNVVASSLCQTQGWALRP